ncbi:MAG: zinc metalloprotease HtpX [Patescibacteria group bacterium]|nr:zinc metalloprotease HtpX [Patescibacteria group bacterium]
MNNTLKTILLFGTLTALLISVGRFIAGPNSFFFMIIIGIFVNLFVYFFSDKIALFSARAKPLKKSDLPEIHQLVSLLAKRAKLPMPRLFISPNPRPNAFATGRNPGHSAIAVTRGLLEHLNKKELKGVLAHEISHIKNRDILIATAAAVLASIITSLTHLIRFGNFFSSSDDDSGRNPLAELVMIILAPVAALIIQLAISRSREFKADETGAKLAQDSLGLASALEKLENISKQIPAARINPAFENLYIINPLANGQIIGVIQKLFSTHPPTRERIARLEKMR